MGVAREPLLGHRLKDQFPLSDGKFSSATRAGEEPIFGVAAANAAGCPVLNDQGTAIGDGTTGSGGHDVIARLATMGLYRRILAGLAGVAAAKEGNAAQGKAPLMINGGIRESGTIPNGLAQFSSHHSSVLSQAESHPRRTMLTQPKIFCCLSPG